MRSTTVIAGGALALLQLVAAQPHHAHHAHQNRHIKRDTGDVVVKVDHVVYAAPAVAPEVLENVFVNEAGKPISTSTTTLNAAAATLVPWSTSAPTPSSTPVPTPSTTAVPKVLIASTSSSSSTPPPPPPSTFSSVYVPSSSSAPAPKPSNLGDFISGAVNSALGSLGGSSAPVPAASGFGVAWSPYRSYGCASLDDAKQDFASFNGQFSYVRIYGVDCDQVAIAHEAAKAHGMKVFAGIFDINNVAGAVSTIQAAANGDYSHFLGVGVGNELVNQGTSPQAVISALNTAQGLFGSNRPSLCIVDTMVAILANPEIGNAGDLACANDHPFFSTPVIDPSNYGSFIQNDISNLRSKLSDSSRQILITETGHPRKGDGSCPDQTIDANTQQTAVNSIRGAFSSGGAFFLSSFDTMWKSPNGLCGAEQYWGMLNNGVAPSGN